MTRTLNADRALWLGVSAAAMASLAGSIAIAQPGPRASEQLAAGRQAYEQNCAACHGKDMDGGQFAPALKGLGFQRRWAEVPLTELFDYLKTSMPPANVGSLSDEEYTAILAMVMAANDAPLEMALTVGRSELASLAVPRNAPPPRGFDIGIGGITTEYAIPDWPESADRLAGYRPVTQAMLNEPEPQDWLSWRRSHKGLGFSPLAQVTRENVKNLQVAWAQVLPAGTNMNEPLVHDGVLYIFGYGDQVFALDATDGRVLWRYQRQVPKGIMLNSKKTMALYGDRLYTSTSDLHLVALDAKTGRPVWDRPITDKPGFRDSGGPLAADGVIMQGLTTQAPGGGLIAGFDAETGEKLWTFNTIAQPGTAGGDTWNGLPADQRKGGSVWTSGSYDAETGLALWGTAQTYDTGPLLERKPGENNDALYTDSTLALDPHTGRLVWYFQHMKNDQWDLDWVFDRVIGTLEVGGKERRVVITSGKEGLFDTLDAETGQYLKTVDMGIQNFVTAIDPETGDKTIDPSKLPTRDETVFVCPHSGGGRNWTPTAFNPENRLLFVNARDICMEMVPSERGFLTSGVSLLYTPRPGHDGRYGLLEALDMQEGGVKWTVRQRAPHTMGVLATAGGVLFTGSVDRQFIAHDQETGKVLWQTGVAGVPNASPISYAVGGRQYIAMVVGHGNPVSAGLPGALTPELTLPPVNNSSIYVFALPDG